MIEIAISYWLVMTLAFGIAGAIIGAFELWCKLPPIFGGMFIAFAFVCLTLFVFQQVLVTMPKIDFSSVDFPEMPFRITVTDIP